ncbi:MAG: hypothetical protein JRI23_16335 [Deltaproteobacteria bacterium]|nr:hypothetical protein [Deltaproteobacteria bacterium]MBW2533340.1 hypothetical protein [Deltaproteobacteria bacterium]
MDKPSPWRHPLATAAASVRRLRERVKLPPYPVALMRGSVLSQMEQALVSAVADTLFPPDGLFPISGTEAGVVPYFDAYLRRCHGQEALLLHLLLFFTELSPVVFGPRPTTFSRLSLEHRTAFLEGAFHSRIYFRRVAFTSMRALMTMAYFAHPDVAAHVGFVTNPDPFDLDGDGSEEVTS